MVITVFELLQTPTGVMDVLVYLATHGPTFSKKAYTDLGMNRGTFLACIEKLRSLDFAFERKEIGYPIRSHYGLTKEGVEVAEMLSRLGPRLRRTDENLRMELAGLERARKTRKNLRRQIDILGIFLERLYRRGDWDEALKIAEKSRVVTSELKDKARSASVGLWTGKILQKKNDDRSISHLDAAFDGASRAGELTVAAEAAYLRGCHYERKGKYDRATDEFQLCKKTATSAKSGLNQGRAELGLGRVLVEGGRHREAREQLEKARKLLEAESDKEELPNLYANLGAAAFAENVKEALEWHEKAIRSCEFGGFLRLLSFELLNAAGCLQKLSESKKAKRYMERSKDLAEHIEDPKLKVSVLIQSGYIESGSGELESAEGHVREAIRIAQEDGLMRELANAHYLLGDVLKKKKQSGEARRYLEEALALFRKLKDEGMTQRLLSELGNLKR